MLHLRFAHRTCIERHVIHSGGLWAGDWLMKTIAIVTKHNIITIDKSSMYLFTADAQSKLRSYGTIAMRPYPATYGKVLRDLPHEALDVSTWYLVFDGDSHYWPAIRTGERPTQSSVQEAGLVLDVFGRTNISDAVRGSVRIRQPN